MTLMVPSTALVTYARLSLGAIATKRGSLAHGNFGQQLRGVGAVGVAHADHRDAGLLAIHDDGAIVIAGERDAAGARLAEQELVTRQRFVGADERAIERRGERDHRRVAGERCGARCEVQRLRCR